MKILQLGKIELMQVTCKKCKSELECVPADIIICDRTPYVTCPVCHNGVCCQEKLPPSWETIIKCQTEEKE